MDITTDMKAIKFHIVILFLCSGLSFVAAQSGSYKLAGHVVDGSTGEPLVGSTVTLGDREMVDITDLSGRFQFRDIGPGRYQLSYSFLSKVTDTVEVEVVAADLVLRVEMHDDVNVVDEVVILDHREDQGGLHRLRQVDGFAIYASKKNDLIELDQLVVNKATNSSRQVYAKVSGLNIWESDGAGVQLGIGGRGLSPSRNANFNTRQNGYDISADALGYPESYYTPPIEAIERIELVRGAASLQYGTQFGGMVNFKMKQGPDDKKIAVDSRQSVGSFGFYNSYNSVGGTSGRIKYYGFYQYKKNEGWRPNESLDQHTAYLSTEITLSRKIKIRPEYTHTQYLAQQPGGLTDAQFNENPRQSSRERNWFSVDWNLFALNVDVELSSRLRINNRSFGLVAGRDALGNLDNINLLDFGENRDFLSDRFRNFGNETRLLYRYNTWDLPSTLLVGTRYYKGKTLRRQGEASAGAGPEFSYLNPDNLEGSDFVLPSENVSVFMENVFSLHDNWTVTPGIRFEQLNTEADGYYRIINKDLAGNVLLDERISEIKSNPRSFVFAGIGSSYKPYEQIEIYTNFSQNYRAINFNDIRVNVGSLKVDENLKDERGFNFDLGIRGRIKDLLDFDLTLYHLSYNDRIGTVLQKEPNPVFNGLVDRLIRYRTNIADAKIYGFESLIQFDIMSWIAPGCNADLSIFSNISVTDAKYGDSEIAGQDGRKVELVPPFMMKVGLVGQWKNLGFNVLYGFTAEHYSDASNAVFTPSAIEGIIPSYQVVDLSVKFAWRQFTWEASINNLLDASYFTRRATGYPGPGIIPSNGRSFYMTVGVSI